MRFLIRADAGPEIGGGHLMRCLTLAEEARRRGHTVGFVVNRGAMTKRVRDAGFACAELEPEAHRSEDLPAHAAWLSCPWRKDAAACAAIIAAEKTDWLVWDHYGLDARWVDAVRAADPALRILALDDLDDRPLASDLLLDAARIQGGERRFSAPGMLNGPDFALLRPEFADRRSGSLGRRDGRVSRVLVTPGMMDAAGLAPLALNALKGRRLEVEIVMGSASQSLAAVRALVDASPGWTLTLDADDMAARMAAADVCIGAGGGTSWERCCLGLPTVAVAVAQNQQAGIDALAECGAVVALSLEEARAGALPAALSQATGRAAEMAAAAAAICDGLGVRRVLDAMEAELRGLAPGDVDLLFAWRDQPHIRAVSHSSEPLDRTGHEAWFARTLHRTDGLWLIYREGARDIGLVSAVDQGDGRWRWSFYVGAPEAPRGAGGRMLAAFLRRLQAEPGCRVVEGEVLPGNARSIELHRRLGFAEVPSSKPEFLVFRKEVCQV